MTLPCHFSRRPVTRNRRTRTVVVQLVAWIREIGLEPHFIDLVFDILDDRRDSEGRTIVMVEQNAKKGLDFADIGYVLVSGQLALAGTGTDLLDDPRHGQFAFWVAEGASRRRHAAVVRPILKLCPSASRAASRRSMAFARASASSWPLVLASGRSGKTMTKPPSGSASNVAG